MRVLVTGANGFVGAALCRTLLAENLTVLGVLRSASRNGDLPVGVQPVVVESLNDLPANEPTIGPLDCVVHLAARVHQMQDKAADPLAAFREVNTQATASLARWAVRQGVRRFVFLSSIKVNGEGQSRAETPHVYTEQNPVAPGDPYGISKWEAEMELQQIAAETALETVILRPTLVYGPEVKANFRQLLRLTSAGLPLPLGRLNNVRSLIYLGNLVDAIRVCLAHPQAAGETFLVSDGSDLSTSRLIHELAIALGCSTRLFPFSPVWLERLGRVSGKSSVMQRLLGTLHVDSRKIRQTLDWQPPYTVQQGLRATADWYQQFNSDLRLARRAA
ncbi:MAG: NAD-dependent dehydratase [Planctomycetaceae bacterium]|nr:NAD-dependent dehydratase [Planctomycetaceae bacterium]